MKELFTIRDNKAGTSLPPHAFQNRAAALREMQMIVNQPVTDDSTLLQKFPQDFSLYFLGNFDEYSQEIAVCDPPDHVVLLSDLRQPEIDKD